MFAEYEKIIGMIEEHIERYPYSYWKRQALEVLRQEVMREHEAERLEFESHVHDGHVNELPY